MTPTDKGGAAIVTSQDAGGTILGRRPRRIPDILDTIAQLSSEEVPTPPRVARAVLDMLPAEVWANPDYRWLDPASKSGSLLREVARRLMDGLADWEPDPQVRAEHILRNMLYGCAITHLTGEMSRRSVYLSRDATSAHAAVQFDEPEGNLRFVATLHDFPAGKDGRTLGMCRVCGAPVGLERGQSRENYAYAFIHGAYPTEEMKGMRFDVIVGNPPYQSSMKDAQGKTAANILPLYHLFVDGAIALEPKYIAMIIPSRWFNGGKGLEEFRQRMIADRRMRVIVDNPKLYDLFPTAEIKGGVNYFLWDRDHDGDCEFTTHIEGQTISTMTRDLRVGDGILLRDNRAAGLVAKVGAQTTKTLADVVSPRDPFGQSITTNFKGAQTQPFDGSVPLVFVSHVGYVRPEQLERNHGWVDRYKVLIPMAGDGHGREVSYVLGEPIALAPGSACTQSYLIAGTFDTAEETENYAHYLTTKFVRFLVLQRKSTQHVRPDKFRFVPALDMTRRWTDADLYEHFGLTADEAAYVEATIHPRSAIFSLESPIPASHLPEGHKYRPPGSKAAVEAEAETDEDSDDEDSE
jgi:site-specific DNA-methyltransferase (adenine-specific)